MRILLCPYHYPPLFKAGGEAYLHRLAKGLISLGHEVKAIVACPERYIFEGVECFPIGRMENIFNENNDQWKWADVAIMQLLGNANAFNKAKQHNKKLIFIAHNTSAHYFTTYQTGIVYNSQTLADKNLYPGNPSTVLQPLVETGVLSKGRKIGLVNCNLNKGGNILIELAKMLPQYAFVGIKGGYGDQITAELPNLTYRENAPEVDYSDIGLLLVPSETESWSMAATEAIMRDIPVICSDLPGIRENLSYAGLYIQRENVNLYAETIVRLMTDKKEQVKLCLQRAKELDPAPRLLEFEKWLIKFVNGN